MTNYRHLSGKNKWKDLLKTPLFLSFVVALLVSGCESASPEENFQKGQAVLRKNDKKEAYKYFLKAAKSKPENGKYQWAAAKAASNSNAAYIHAKKAWDAGLRSQEVLLGILYTRLEAQEQKNLDYGFQLFEELPDSLKTDVFRGELHFRFGSLDSSIGYWSKAFKKEPSGLVCHKLGAAYQRQRDIPKAIRVLEQCLENKILDESGYVLLANLYANNQDNASVEDLFSKAKASGDYNAFMMLNHGSFLNSRNKFTEAEKILKPIAGLKDPSLKHMARGAKIHLAYGSYMMNKNGALKELIHALKSQEGIGSNEVQFYTTLEEIASSEGEGDAYLDFKPVPRVHDVALSLAAKELNKTGLYENSNLMLRHLSGFFASAHDLWILKAYNLSNVSKEDEALRIIHSLHDKKIITKNSLLLMRDICHRKNWRDKRLAAQKLLEKHFPDDRDVFLQSARYAISDGNSKKALSILSELSEKYPEDSEILAERIEFLFQLERYQKVIALASRHHKFNARVAVTLAGAYQKTGKTDKAEQIYRRAVKEKASPLILLHFADFLVKQGKNTEASKMFERAVKNETVLKKNRKLFAIALNNYAWSLTQADNFDSKSSLEAIEKALSLFPGEPYLLDTYAVCLLKSGQPKKWIAFFDKHLKNSTEPQLLLHLARAYLELNNLNQASRTYQKSLEKYDGNYVLSVRSSRSEIKNEIKRINNL